MAIRFSFTWPRGVRIATPVTRSLVRNDTGPGLDAQSAGDRKGRPYGVDGHQRVDFYPAGRTAGSRTLNHRRAKQRTARARAQAIRPVFRRLAWASVLSAAAGALSTAFPA